MRPAGLAVLLTLVLAAPAAAGTRVRVAPSPFGKMVWTAHKQALYVFSRDRRGESRCYGHCAKEWPPLYTDGAPVAGRGIRKELLGTARRRNGRLQVTYRGRPLYSYAHERRDQVLCHDIELNGGTWWAVGPDGRPLP